MRLVIFDDGGGDLSPMTDLRPVFDLRTGILTTRARIERACSRKADALWVPQRLHDVVTDARNGSVNAINGEGPILLVNGRWVSSPQHLALRTGEAIRCAATGEILAACVTDAEAARNFLFSGQLPAQISIRDLDHQAFLQHPWDLIRFRDEAITADAALYRIADAHVLTAETPVVGDQPVEVDRAARVYPGAVFDAERGPIIVERDAVIRPGAVLCGPCFVGPGSVVVDRAHIKANTVIGPMCKVGGEVGGTIFQGFSNKSHEGHLGDSWIGEWVNFGAGTTNSNLLNTYGEISMKVRPTRDAPRQRTGLTFLGAIVGDHVKFAINTRIMTGSIIGTGAMIAATAPAPTTVPPFAWLTDEGERRYRIDKFIDVARTVMARRHIDMSDAYETALRSLGG